MKVLYAIQGTGNGHLSRAMEIVPLLKKKVKTDVLVSGMHSELQLPFEIDFRLHGLGFIFGKNGGIDLLETYKKSRLRNFRKEIRQLPVENYDLIISDFEPVSSRAGKKRGVPVIGLSNQVAVMAEGAPQPKKFDPVGKYILKNYAPVDLGYGFHFQRYNKNIYTPIIRNTIRTAESSENGHYTVYLPAYNDEKIIQRLRKFNDIEWHVFSKHTKKKYREKNVHIQPIDNDTFMKSFTTCTGIITGAGFGTPTEALYLGKKLMVVPMKTQYEQQCNALALKNMGVTVIGSLKKKHLPTISSWLEEKNPIVVHYPNETEQIIESILESRLSRFIKPVKGKRISA